MRWAPSRRRVLATLSSATAAGLIGGAKGLAQEAPPETTTIRLVKIPGICVAPQYVAEELLRTEGFTDIQYFESPGSNPYPGFEAGKIDVASNQEFVRRHPVATKRALRAIVKAANFCAAEPERAARLVADKGYRYDYSLQTMKEIAYARWRDYDAEDTVRFYALRLHESGMIKSTPSKIITQGADWRYFNELKRELKT
jgi:ABC-type nitrate/sulfonate/bicarbonate transport system substrate-binding protein